MGRPRCISQMPMQKGSFAAQVDPLLLQSYKTAMCFLTSWIALAFEPLEYTGWGVIGAAIWVSPDPAGDSLTRQMSRSPVGESYSPYNVFNSLCRVICWAPASPYQSKGSLLKRVPALPARGACVHVCVQQCVRAGVWGLGVCLTHRPSLLRIILESFERGSRQAP